MHKKRVIDGNLIPDQSLFFVFLIEIKMDFHPIFSLPYPVEVLSSK